MFAVEYVPVPGWPPASHATPREALAEPVSLAGELRAMGLM
ncbi:MAG TPA: hypothetical protein VK284_02525 [Streptosporangiaceae bacterium]|nr:hypothetical protein [Streptosporangiaceae bacterium]